MMLHRLCLVFGAPYIHPDALAADLTATQLQDWSNFYNLERFGGPADDYRAALVAWAALAGGRGTKLTPEKLVPQWSHDPPSPAEYMAKAKAAYARMGRGIEDGNRGQ